MQKLHTPQPALLELHPVELALLALMALAWAIATLARLVLVPALALLLVLTGLDRPRAAELSRAPQTDCAAGDLPRAAELSRAPGDAPATDLATALEISRTANLTDRLDPDQKGGCQTSTLRGRRSLAATDLATALEVSNSRDMVARLDPDQKGVSQGYTPGGRQALTFVSESGCPTAHHPLAALRDELALLTVRQLRQMAGAAARKNARKQELIEALLFCG